MAYNTLNRKVKTVVANGKEWDLQTQRTGRLRVY